MIDWTDEAIEAALQELHGTDWRGLSEKMNTEAIVEMRAALDAAVKAQAMTTEDWMSGIGYCRGYNDALEEAAQIEGAKKE